ncbi:hypothetical protein CMV_028110 [Castanea mollissima]|uniref:Uncharacterized protein n=1 Tax=Castanea mollissima TaxID=60419 RepID=A0A8J4VCF8_9ROSI|nr:hypothetical protein CMV_028110 [Castanea mollissima]
MSQNTTSVTKYKKSFIFKVHPTYFQAFNLYHLATPNGFCDVNIHSNPKKKAPSKATLRSINSLADAVFSLQSLSEARRRPTPTPSQLSQAHCRSTSAHAVEALNSLKLAAAGRTVFNVTVPPGKTHRRSTETHADQPSRPQTHAVQALNSLKTLSSSPPISPLSSPPISPLFHFRSVEHL